MDNIYLVRHGQSQGNADKSAHIHIADHALTLTDLGHKQAFDAGRALASIIKLAPNAPLRVWTSPYERTRQTTAEILKSLQPAHPQLDVREHLLLCEQQYGLFDGIEDEDLPNLFPNEHKHYARAEQQNGKIWPRMPLGESRFDVAQRVHQAFGTFHRDSDKHGIRNIVVVCHGVTMRAFIMMWLHLPYEWMNEEPNPGNCDIYHIDSRNKESHGYVYQNGILVQDSKNAA